jgi:hypothetical protein
MTARARTLRGVTIVVVAVVVNALLDLTLDLPILVRWGIALVAVLLVLRLTDRRDAAPRWAGGEERRVPPTGPAGPGHPHEPYPFGGGPVDRGKRLGGG